MFVILKPVSSGAVTWIAGPLQQDAVAALWWEGKEISGFPGREQALIALLKQRQTAYIDAEFTAVAGMQRLRQELPHSQVLAHTIPRQELLKYRSPADWADRWTRAVAERGVRLIGIWFSEHYTISEHFAAVVSLTRRLKHRGFMVAGVQPPVYPQQQHRTLRLFGIMLAALCFPVAGIAAAVRVRAHWLLQFFIASAITGAGASVVSAVLYDAGFMQKLQPVPGIKLLLLLPLIMMPAMLYRRREIVGFLARTITVYHLVAGMLISAMVAVMLLRAGNTGLPVPPAESWMREVLEHLMAVRPRTKEFLIGHPLLIAGFAWRKRWLIWLGAIGQVSIINTFLHAHTPLSISLLRTLYGIAMGMTVAAGALLLVRVYRTCRRGKIA
jgi:hypothetical protein